MKIHKFGASYEGLDIRSRGRKSDMPAVGCSMRASGDEKCLSGLHPILQRLEKQYRPDVRQYILWVGC